MRIRTTVAPSTTDTRCAAARSSRAASRSRARRRPTTSSRTSASMKNRTCGRASRAGINPVLGSETGLEQAMSQELSGFSRFGLPRAPEPDRHGPGAARILARTDRGSDRPARGARCDDQHGLLGRRRDYILPSPCSTAPWYTRRCFYAGITMIRSLGLCYWRCVLSP